jgi:hypothetical protein
MVPFTIKYYIYIWVNTIFYLSIGDASMWPNCLLSPTHKVVHISHGTHATVCWTGPDFVVHYVMLPHMVAKPQWIMCKRKSPHPDFQ